MRGLLRASASCGRARICFDIAVAPVNNTSVVCFGMGTVAQRDNSDRPKAAPQVTREMFVERDGVPIRAPGVGTRREPAVASAEASTGGEHGGPDGPEPTRYGDWERNGRCSDF